ncbi:CBS domain-containing protein [Methanobacterium alkalithermotolerans]|uniref:CBS domain-containing protein n=1 Tax=Methanobacterium alkalithermotolerans TaxID=2731220 RepID=A0A8T8K5N3_9EURY|nr:CBS domain-containing protein [Methanobacterium alkalithermotolerans]QUH23219.1 CBS domain-containing protein [Methanobacterium alkalithermotolerans]
MKVQDIMTEEVVVIQDTDQVAYARNLMIKNGFSRIVVINKEGHPVGIVTERDITHKMRGNGPNWKRRPIDKISINRVMNTDLITISPGENVKEAVEMMLKKDISSLIVVDEEGLAGIITKTDLIKIYGNKYTGKWKISDLMSSEVVTVNENHGINHVISLMEEKKIGRIVVIRDSNPVGIITTENISFAQIEDPETGINVEKIYFIRPVEGAEKKNVRMVSMLTAGDLMTNHLVIMDADEDAAAASKLMLEKDISGMPVVKDEELVGIITKTDIIKGIQ